MRKRYREVEGKRIPIKRLEGYTEEISQALEKQQALKELGEYSSEIDFVLTDYNRKSCEETMMVKGLRKSCQETTNRKTHTENLTNIAVMIAKGINQKEHQNKQVGLNYEIISIMGKHHDIGHTFSGHSGEWWISNIKEDYGMGYYCHNALGPRELIYTNQIYDKIIETIKQRHPEIGENRINRIRKNLWLIMEGINSHNGERSESEYIANSQKTEKDFERENLYCHTKKGFDKVVVPATPEAALMRLCDKISYIPYDMVDGLREGFITGLNEEYRVVLRKLGITDEEIEECELTRHYEKIARKLQVLFISDVIQNSTGNIIKMSSKMSKLLHELRNINNRQIVNFTVLKEDNETYPPAIRKFMNIFGKIAVKEGLLLELRNGEISKEKKEQLIKKYKGTPYEGFIQYTCNTNQSDFEYTTKIIEEATKQSIFDEQEKAREIVNKREPFVISKDFSIKDRRIKSYVNYYKNKDVNHYTEEEKEQDVKIMLQNIKNPRRKSYLHFSMDKRIVLELGSKYLATLNDIEFMELLRATKMVDDDQYASLTRKYKDIDLKKESYIQENWKSIQKEQVESVNVQEK